MTAPSWNPPFFSSLPLCVCFHIQPFWASLIWRCFFLPRTSTLYNLPCLTNLDGSFPFVSQPHGSESDYQNVEFLTFINPEHVIYDIGTEILCKTCFGHNSTQNAPKSINPVRFYTVFCVDSESAIKTRFKALFKKWPPWIRCYRFPYVCSVYELFDILLYMLCCIF